MDFDCNDQRMLARSPLKAVRVNSSLPPLLLGPTSVNTSLAPLSIALSIEAGPDIRAAQFIDVLTNIIPVITLLSMKIEFDPAKDAANVQKHGVSLALAVEFDWNMALTWSDTRRTYGESRQCAMALLGDRLYFVAFVDRGECRRIISLRKTNNREKLHYANTFDAS